MADRWMDERDRRWREREDRRSEPYGRGGDYGRDAEDRSFDRDRVFGEEESGAGYGAPRPDDRTRGYGGRAGWQARDYRGVSPAMAQDEYEAEQHRGRPRFSHQDYTGGGRDYGDDRAPIYREAYGQGGVDDDRGPRGYDAGYRRAGPAYGASGGYDDGRGGYEGRAEQAGREAGEFLRRAGRRVAGWFRGDDLMDDGRPYRGEPRYLDERSHRGRGPKGYKRTDERIAEEVNQRLTDDAWLDASNIDVALSAGEVTLSGTVENREAKHRAEHIVEDVSGVTHVQNNLRVGAGAPLTTPGRGFGDSALEAQMRKDETKGDGPRRN